MKDRLEEFVRSHRSEFDVLEPRPELWKNIEKSINRKKTDWRFYLSRAAVIVFLIGATLVGQRVWMNRGKDISAEKADIEINIPELKEAEMYYNGMINAKLNEVKPRLSGYPSLEEELENDLAELDSIYASLKNDLKDDIANQEVIEAMIQNYRLRIDILEDMLNFLVSQETNEETHNTEQI